MLVSTTTDLYIDVEKEKESIRDLIKIGFDAFDYSFFRQDVRKTLYLKDNYDTYAKSLFDLVKEHDRFFAQMHSTMFAPFTQDKYEEEKFELTIRSFHVSSIIGSPYLVIHLRNFGNTMTSYEKEKTIELNLEFIGKLIPYAKKYNVKIALENLFGVDKATGKMIKTARASSTDLLYYMDTLDGGKENIVTCLDTGHARLTDQSPADVARELGNTLKLLHVHDNFGIKDDHLFPYNGIIDWDDFMRALADINYDGVFSLEANGNLSKLPPELAVDSAKHLLNIGRYMANKIENLKQNKN